MQQFLIYEGKVAIVMAVFYLFFRVLLSKEALHRLNRIVLVSTVIASFILPLCIITIHKTVLIEESESSSAAAGASIQAETVADKIPEEEADRTISWWSIADAAYLLGTVLMLLKVVSDIIRLRGLIARGEHHTDKSGSTIVVLDEEVSPFSWMRWIFLSREDYNISSNHILEHERAHIRLGHARELLLVEVLSSMQWFNPAMWYLKSDLKSIYEYEADNLVLKNGADIKDYQYSLVRKALLAGGYSITNSFNHTTLKNRITMMSRPMQSGLRALKCLYILPLLCAALALNARTVTSYEKVSAASDNDAQLINVEIKLENGSPVTIIEGEKVPIEKVSDVISPIVAEKEAATVVISAEPDITMGSVTDLKEALRDAGADRLIFSEISGADTVKAVSGVIDEIMVRAYASGKEAPAVRPERTPAKLDGPKTAEVPVAYADLTVKPLFDGNDGIHFNRWISSVLWYPEECITFGDEGIVSAQFKVNSDGKVSDIRVSGDCNDILKEEVFKTINRSPVWTPGQKNGKPVATTYTVTVNFSIKK